MTNYYTNVACVGNNILYRGIKNGRRVKLKIGYSPTLFLPSKKPTEFKTLDGDFLEPMRFDSIRETRDFVKRYDEVSNFKIYGNTNYQYAFIADEQKGMVDWNIDDISIAVIDIEVGSENGFPDPYLANEPITAIAIKYLNGDIWVFGCGDYETKGKEKFKVGGKEFDVEECWGKMEESGDINELIRFFDDDGNPIKDDEGNINYFCTDPSRKIFKFKNSKRLN